MRMRMRCSADLYGPACELESAGTLRTVNGDTNRSTQFVLTVLFVPYGCPGSHSRQKEESPIHSALLFPATLQQRMRAEIVSARCEIGCNGHCEIAGANRLLTPLTSWKAAGVNPCDFALLNRRQEMRKRGELYLYQ